MNFQNAIKSGFKNYANFSGRASRSEYWFFQLFLLLSLLLLYFVSAVSVELGALSLFALLGIYLPSIAVGWRRAHDAGRSGGWMAIPFVGFILALQASETNSNKFGPPPPPPGA